MDFVSNVNLSYSLRRFVDFKGPVTYRAVVYEDYEGGRGKIAESSGESLSKLKENIEEQLRHMGYD